MAEKHGEIAGEYDLVVGIPSYNEGDSISFVAKQVDKGLSKHYPDKKAIIMNVDGGSTDNTKESFLNTITKAKKTHICKKGITGKGNVFKILFNYVKSSDADAIMVVDADLTSINTDWPKLLLNPILEGYDYCTPIYSRHKYDGTITNNLVYPLIFSLLGKNIRQPIGGDFAFSKKLSNYWLDQGWKDSTHHFGIDNFMTLHALIGGFKVCQTGLGAKDHKPSAPRLGQMFLEVVDTLFENLLKNIEKWETRKLTEETNKYGYKNMNPPKDLSLKEIGIDIDAMTKNTTALFKEYKYELSAILEPELFEKVNEMFATGKIKLTSELWAKTVYDFLTAYYHAGSEKLKVVEYLKPLYFMRSISFIKETMNYSNEEAELSILRQAQVFRELKPYILDKLEQKTKLIL